MEVVEISREERDVYLIPQNFVDTGTILGGTVKLRNAVEAAVLAVGSAVPLFYLPLAFNIRLMIVIAVSVPLGVFGVVGIGGDSLTQFVAHWFRFMKRRRIVTPTPQGNLEANRHRHLRFISKRYRVVYYDDPDTLPHNAQVLQRKADRHGKLVKRQTLYDLLPIEKIENGILHTTDDHYIKILEIDPINFLLRSPREQRSVIYSFASLLKVSPVRLQFKSFSRKADVNAYLDKLRRDAANEPDAAVRKRHMSYIRFVKRLGFRDAVSRRFFVIFQYEAPTNERNIAYAEIVSTLETTARNFRTYLAQCGNAIVEHENEDEFLTDVCYIVYTFNKDETYDRIGIQSPSLDAVFGYEHKYIEMVRSGINLALEPKKVYTIPFDMNKQKYELIFQIGHNHRLGLLEDFSRKGELILPLHTNEIQECYDIATVLCRLAMFMTSHTDILFKRITLYRKEVSVGWFYCPFISEDAVDRYNGLFYEFDIMKYIPKLLNNIALDSGNKITQSIPLGHLGNFDSMFTPQRFVEQIVAFEYLFDKLEHKKAQNLQFPLKKELEYMFNEYPQLLSQTNLSAEKVSNQIKEIRRTIAHGYAYYYDFKNDRSSKYLMILLDKLIRCMSLKLIGFSNDDISNFMPFYP